MKRRTDALRLLLALLVALAFVWLVSTKEQRHQYFIWLGIANPAHARASSAHDKTFAPRLAIGLPAPESLIRTQPGAGGFTFSPVAHEAVGSPCVAEGIANPTRSTQGQIYSWVDAEGRKNFSDKPPDQEPSAVIGTTAGGGVSTFSADYKYLGKPPQTEFQRALERNIDGVFRMFSTELQLRTVEPLHVNITVIDGIARFTQYRNKKTSGLATTAGYYSFSENEAVVRWAGQQRTLAVARHEITHLALGNWLGSTPLWFNEGMAEVMEQLEFQQSYARAEAPLSRVQHLRELHRSGKLPAFRRFLDSERGDWDRIGNDTAYSYAWSLVYFLIQDAQRQQLVSNYLNAVAEHRCQRFDHANFFETGYPGGLASFEAGWRQWLTRETPVALQF